MVIIMSSVEMRRIEAANSGRASNFWANIKLATGEEREEIRIIIALFGPVILKRFTKIRANARPITILAKAQARGSLKEVTFVLLSLEPSIKSIKGMVGRATISMILWPIRRNSKNREWFLEKLISGTR